MSPFMTNRLEHASPSQPPRYNSAHPQSLKAVLHHDPFLALLRIPPDQSLEFHADLLQNIRVLVNRRHTFRPQRRVAPDARQLAIEMAVEIVDAFFRPSDHGRPGDGREGRAEIAKRVHQESKRGERQSMEVRHDGAGEGQLPRSQSDDVGASLQISRSRHLLVSETQQPRHVDFGAVHFRAGEDELPRDVVGEFGRALVDFGKYDFLRRGVAFDPSRQFAQVLHAIDGRVEVLEGDVDVERVDLAFDPAEGLLAAVGVDDDGAVGRVVGASVGIGRSGVGGDLSEAEGVASVVRIEIV